MRLPQRCCVGVADFPLLTFPGSEIMTAAMDAQLAAWLAERGLANAAGWELCYSSPRGDDKSSPTAWHAQCDGNDRTVVVGANSPSGVYDGRVHRHGVELVQRLLRGAPVSR